MKPGNTGITEWTTMRNKNCVACGKNLINVFENVDQYEQYNNALWVEFTGGYGEFVDVLVTPNPYQAVICHECAHDLCDKIPWIGKLIDPHNSHTHTEEYKRTNPGHYGWDYD